MVVLESTSERSRRSTLRKRKQRNTFSAEEKLNRWREAWCACVFLVLYLRIYRIKTFAIKNFREFREFLENAKFFPRNLGR